MTETIQPSNVYTRIVPGAEALELDETDGTQTIAKAKSTFAVHIDPDFIAYGCDVKSVPTDKMWMSVRELVKDGTFAQIFGDMSDDLNKFVLTQSQIIQFVQKHKRWLRRDEYATFFLFKTSGGFFVASVRWGDDQLGVRVRRLLNVCVWCAEDHHYLVIPRLEC